VAGSTLDLGSARKELETHLGRLNGELAELEKARLKAREVKDEYAGYGNHVGEAATETFEAERDLALIDKLEGMRSQVNAALERIEQGTYGDCITCGQPIPRERLEALPFAGQCVSCKSKEQSH
jgi:DnaK suppressor protein